ncbi:MAG: hypothetical protein HN855_07535 [Anaerolineae bacterium]|nr:hypothetical protein [Anaerolineae bacterium]MBT7071957.1 hypothetical protein [Anaerolineae bacterium]MBT7324991.1 hypothetical protein [Anaerolineae bacterium]
MTNDNQDLAFAQIKRAGKPHGIAFERDDGRTLWLADKQTATGVLPAQDDLYTYFYELRFLDDFPQITHWTFGSAWTQQVMLQRPEQVDGDELRGRMFFASEDDLGIYKVERSYDLSMRNAPQVYVPLPKLFQQVLNIPLQIVLAQMVTKALDDELPYDQWHVVSSLLLRDEVVDIFTTDMAATYGFQIKALPNDLRQALCELQSLER